MTIDFTNAPAMDVLPSEDGRPKLALAGERLADLKHAEASTLCVY
jgi:hypothetical protein